MVYSPIYILLILLMVSSYFCLHCRHLVCGHIETPGYHGCLQCNIIGKRDAEGDSTATSYGGFADMEARGRRDLHGGPKLHEHFVDACSGNSQHKFMKPNRGWDYCQLRIDLISFFLSIHVSQEHFVLFLFPQIPTT